MATTAELVEMTKSGLFGQALINWEFNKPHRWVFLGLGEGIAGRWEVAEDGYEEQIIIPKEQRELAAREGSTSVIFTWQ